MGPERRKAVRIEKSVTVLYSNNFDRLDWNMANVKDVSESGIKITVDKNLPPGEIVALRVKIPLDPFRWLEIKGKVVNSSVIKGAQNDKVLFYITQITFVDIKDEDKKLIAQYISWYLNRRA